MSQTFTVSDNARVEIRHCHNRVTVVGWDDAHNIAVDANARQDGDTLVVENENKVTLRVPHAAAITLTDCKADVRVDDLTGRVELTNIGGDVALRNLRGQTFARDIDGDLVAQAVAALTGAGTWDGDVALRDVKSIHLEAAGGDLNLSEVAAATINQVEGDLVAKNCQALNGGVWAGDVVLRGVAAAEIAEIEGDLSVGDVGNLKLQTLDGDLSAHNIKTGLTIDDIKGDVSLRDSSGRIAIERIGGDFMAANARGAISASDIEGDAVVSFAEIAELDLRADGDVVLNLPENANAEIELDTPRGDLVVNAQLLVTARDESHLRGTLGTGGVKVSVESTRGDLILRQNGASAHQENAREPADKASHAGAADYSTFADMGRRIAEEVRKSVHDALADVRVPEIRARQHGFDFRMPRRDRHADRRARAAVEEQPRGPAAGSPERKAILDAIARGELNIDDAIKKLTGEE